MGAGRGWTPGLPPLAQRQLHVSGGAGQGTDQIRAEIHCKGSAGRIYGVLAVLVIEPPVPLLDHVPRQGKRPRGAHVRGVEEACRGCPVDRGLPRGRVEEALGGRGAQVLREPYVMATA